MNLLQAERRRWPSLWDESKQQRDADPEWWQNDSTAGKNQPPLFRIEYKNKPQQMAQAVSTTPAKDVLVWFRLKTRLVVYLNLLRCLNRTRWPTKNNCSLINHIIIFRLSSQRKYFDAADGTFPESLDLYQGAAPNQTKKKNGRWSNKLPCFTFNVDQSDAQLTD